LLQLKKKKTQPWINSKQIILHTSCHFLIDDVIALAVIHSQQAPMQLLHKHLGPISGWPQLSWCLSLGTASGQEDAKLVVAVLINC